ncbi:hypothetical protein [Pelosinus sp. UFO1]|uniref:hypothetical protein n=1 Tax=Pelosinus sp. UFO1 TaxID=484770 RepID=UPI0004D1FC28|nr:hypothetical protein [Pelosinus sp. UFO1]AIF52030.1 hypothetical protein UFO1_2483 [Pelosinus sp. UFO1]
MDAKTAAEIMRGNWSKLKVRDIHKTYDEIADFIEQQEIYAELGRLVVGCNNGICHHLHYNEKWNACRQCCGFKACQKRAELLGEGQK